MSTNIQMTTNKAKEKLIHPELSYTTVGYCYYVHNQLGRYAREKQYGDLLEVQFKDNKVKFSREVPVGDDGNIVDFVVEDKIVLELKAKPHISKEDFYQVQRYLHSLDLKLGLLVNFRSKYLSPHRVIRIDTQH